VVILDPKLASIVHDLAQAQHLNYEHNRQWQESRVIQLSWAKSVFGEDRKIRQVWCKVCFEVEKREIVGSKIGFALEH